MFYALTRKAERENILPIFEHFKGTFPNITDRDLYDRIYCGYCWGEGALPIIDIEDWNNVFNYTQLGRAALTFFKDWDEYFKYGGDFHKHPRFTFGVNT